MWNVILLGLTSFFTDISSEIIQSVLPAFLVSIGVGSVGIGVIAGIGDFFSNILKIISGRLSDKFGRKKPFVFFGYLLSSFSKAILPLSRNFYGVIAYRILDRTGKGIRTAPRDSLISKSSKKRTGLGFGIHRALDTLGAVLGSVIAISLFFLGYKILFWIAVFISFLALIPLIFVKEIKEEKKEERRGDLRALAPIFIFSFANISYMFFLLKVIDILGDWVSVIFYLLFNVVYAFFSIPFGVLSDKFGKRRVLSLSYLLFSFVLISLFFSNSLFGFFLTFFLYGLFFSMKDGVERAYVSEFVGKGGSEYGVYHFGIGMISLVSNVVFGMLLKYFGWSVLFGYSLIPLISFLVLVRTG